MKSKIEKNIVTNGVYYVSIAEAKLNILCGSPADVVKHLMQKGFIAKKIKDDIEYESGPNAILLSDVSVQNGYFSNLSEFPILQMLYRQGMILPNHPNNDGSKPILIGLTTQIDSQMNYIYRGNYGLVSTDELEAAGASKEEADQIMRMKLKFAFGKIKDTNELLDRLDINNCDKVMIKNGVYIQRNALNDFTISYDESSVDVNLNLKKNIHYSSPYSLGHYDIDREYFAVIHSGQGDGWDIHRPSMSSILMFHGNVYLIDAGANIENILQSLGIGLNEVYGIFHTHAHDDHFAGITSLLQTDHKIKYYASPLVRATVAKKLTALLNVDESEFEKYFDICDLELDKWNNIDGLEVKPVFSPHPIETNLFLFRTIWSDGYKTYAHYADIGSFEVLENMVTDNVNEIGISREFFESTKKKYLESVTLKKLDIGGGMIHGDAKDFVSDESDKIILAHTSNENLSQIQKSIGSGAQFGAIDVLIQNNQDFLRRNAYFYLYSHFPDIDKTQIKVLLNCNIKTFNPETILLREYKSSQMVYLIITGDVEVIDFEENQSKIISSGAFIGDMNALLEIPLIYTFRACSYVNALEIPVELFTMFVIQNNLQECIGYRIRTFEILNEFDIFSNVISFPVKNSIANALEFVNYKSGDIIEDKDVLYIYFIISGNVKRVNGANGADIIKRKECFGEEQLFTNKKTSCKYIAVDDIELYKIPINLINEIPMLYWKLFEQYNKTFNNVNYCFCSLNV